MFVRRLVIGNSPAVRRLLHTLKMRPLRSSWYCQFGSTGHNGLMSFSPEPDTAAKSPSESPGLQKIMAVGQRYRCQNPHCRCEIEVIQPSAPSQSMPRCICGAEMKKPYQKPQFRKCTGENADGLLRNGKLRYSGR